VIHNTITSLLKYATSQLASNSDSARIDAELLLCYCLNKERSYLFTWPEKIIEEQQVETFQRLLQQRIEGVPVAYLIGSRDFWTLNLKVTKDTLIPRPETELLVETALEKIPQDKPFSVLDLGTGTGAIALSIASERPLGQVLAVDVSAKALRVAKQNADDNRIDNVQFLQSSWFEQIPDQTFDLIVSNPPYIEDNDPHLDQGDVRYEPKLALTSGFDGFDDIRKIISHSPQYIKLGGWLMFEHGYNQADYSRELLRQNGQFSEISSLFDLAGHKRVSLGVKKIRSCTAS